MKKKLVKDTIRRRNHLRVVVEKKKSSLDIQKRAYNDMMETDRPDLPYKRDHNNPIQDTLAYEYDTLEYQIGQNKEEIERWEKRIANCKEKTEHMETRMNEIADYLTEKFPGYLEKYILTNRTKREKYNKSEGFSAGW